MRHREKKSNLSQRSKDPEKKICALFIIAFSNFLTAWPEFNTIGKKLEIKIYLNLFCYQV
jgi:hypothetical protein